MIGKLQFEALAALDLPLVKHIGDISLVIEFSLDSGGSALSISCFIAYFPTLALTMHA